MHSQIKLKIADIIIQMQSDCALERYTQKEHGLMVLQRTKNFLYVGAKKPQIEITVHIVDRLPGIGRAQLIFSAKNSQDNCENWRLYKKGPRFIYESRLPRRRQYALVNEAFDRTTMYLMPKENKTRVWNIDDIIYDFLQVLLIHYLARKKSGIFIHSVGIKDIDGAGLLFSGKSGCGKSTIARLWHNHSKALVLNDERIIVVRRNGTFLMHSSPWHGEFSDYFAASIKPAMLKKFFVIYHAAGHTKRATCAKETFAMLYPTVLPAFWNKQYLKNIVSFAQDLIAQIPCYSLGFVNNKKVIRFVRRI